MQIGDDSCGSSIISHHNCHPTQIMIFALLFADLCNNYCHV